MSQVLHLVMWKLKGDTAADKAAHALTLKIAFMGMQHHLPGLLEVNAGANEVRGEGAFDFAISMRFASWADLKAYNIHPAHEDIKHLMRKIRTEHSCAEAAFNDVFEKYVSVLGAVDDAYLRERAADLRDVAGRVLDHLSGAVHEHQLQHLSEPCILVAHDLAPSVTAVLDRKHVLGFATEVGGKTSHTAIMARKMGIPAVVGLGPMLDSLQDGEYALLDGHGGVLTLNPTDQTLFEYGQLKQRRAVDLLISELRGLRARDAERLDERDDAAHVEAAERGGAKWWPVSARSVRRTRRRAG
jgi:signal transduction protein with GAF and PtsI domain